MNKAQTGVGGQIWSARSNPSKKYRWLLVAAKTLLFPVFLYAVFVAWAMFAVANLAEAITGSMYAIVPFFWHVVETSSALFLLGMVRYTSHLVEMASNFYAIAADMVRGGKQSLVVKLSFAVSGGLAVMFAFTAHVTSFLRSKPFSITDRDVLGSIFTRAKLYRFALTHWHVISARYTSSLALPEGEEKMQVAVSTALACKWMLLHPNCLCKDILKEWIRNILAEYGNQLSPEVTVRLFEVLDDSKELEAAKVALAQKYPS